jgi:hypothetical protein
MKTNVNITVVQTNKDGTDDIGYSLQGRLLGACNEKDACKIVQNWPIIERVLTSGTSTLEESVNVLNEIHKEEDEKGFGHLVVALSALGRMEHPEMVEVLTRQLFVTAPIQLFAEEPANPATKKQFSVNLDCADGSMITMEEVENE